MGVPNSCRPLAADGAIELGGEAMSTPIVSVVMSVYKGERFLRESVESILDQGFCNFEFIIIDDGSTDSSASLLDSYQRNDPRVRVYHQENRGLVESLNCGCGLARGKYIARMDADDIAVRDRLMKQIEFMEEHPEVAVLGGAIEVINTVGKSLATHHYPIKNPEIQQALLHGDCPLVHPAILMRKDVFASVGGYRKVVIDAEDYDLWLRMADRSQLANLEAVVLKYRRHPYQISIRRSKRQALSNLTARISAELRRNGKPDALDSIGEITPAVLAELGVSEARQQDDVARGYLTSVLSMYEAREYSVACNLLNEMLMSSEWKNAESSVVADSRLLAARLYWRKRRFAKSILSAGHAVITRPIMLARPLKPFLSRVRLLFAQYAKPF
jgi:glycosyltransferase involved in cell wall biosynthesis